MYTELILGVDFISTTIRTITIANFDRFVLVAVDGFGDELSGVTTYQVQKLCR